MNTKTNYINKFCQSDLQNLEFKSIRSKIDDIDQQILALLEQRIKLIKKAKELKSKFYPKNKCFITPGREASMVKLLANQNKETSYSKEFIVNLWRIIISASIATEVPITLNIYHTETFNQSYIDSIAYFSTFIPRNFIDNAQNILERTNAAPNNIAIMPFSKKHIKLWWLELFDNYKDLKIFAMIPFVKQRISNSNIESVLISNIVTEETGYDISFIVIESVNRLCEEYLSQLQENKFIMIDQAEKNNLYYTLVKAKGFYALDCKINFDSENVLTYRVIGSYSAIIE